MQTNKKKKMKQVLEMFSRKNKIKILELERKIFLLKTDVLALKDKINALDKRLSSALESKPQKGVSKKK